MKQSLMLRLLTTATLALACAQTAHAQSVFALTNHSVFLASDGPWTISIETPSGRLETPPIPFEATSLTYRLSRWDNPDLDALISDWTDGKPTPTTSVFDGSTFLEDSERRWTLVPVEGGDWVGQSIGYVEFQFTRTRIYRGSITTRLLTVPEPTALGLFGALAVCWPWRRRA